MIVPEYSIRGSTPVIVGEVVWEVHCYAVNYLDNNLLDHGETPILNAINKSHLRFRFQMKLFLPRKRQDFGVYFVRALIVDCGVMMRTLRQGRISDGGTAALRLNAIGCNLQGGLKEVDLSYSHDFCISREPIYHTAGPLAVSQISTNGVMHLR